jgi:alanyl-tRNA synthetase
MNFNKIRFLFINYFKNNQHHAVESSTVIPKDDPTLLFTNAGMNQFKNYFLGIQNAPYASAVSSQKCIRAGGKHNDLSQVGFTERHLTFFEMLGNFAFNSYFKKEAIQFAWDFLTNHLHIDPNLLWVTVYLEDDEAYNIWKDIIGVSPLKIHRLGAKDNFWQMGETGPCGPCSEIYVDRGIKLEIDKNAKPGDDDSIRFIEIWNLVFMQFNKNNLGELVPLVQKGIDTGMGLERLCMILEKGNNIFETSLFIPIIKKIEELTNINYKTYENPEYFHVLADHIRSSSFIISEGLIPGNEGRNYVLRKIIRRALLFAYKLGHKKIFSSLVDIVAELFKDSYPEIEKNHQFIKETIAEEQERFLYNLELGYKKFDLLLKKQENKDFFSGNDAFLLYDTYGFPLELTQILAHDHNLMINEQEFNESMNEQQKRSKDKSTFKTNLDIPIGVSSIFCGYNQKEITSTLEHIVSFQNKYYAIFDKTVFYPEGGGQEGDSGYLEIDTIKIPILHTIKYQETILLEFEEKNLNHLKVGQSILQVVNSKNRALSSFHHTATHLLQAAIKKHIDNDASQKGSFVNFDILTFDFNTTKQLASDDILKLEEIVNQWIQEGHQVQELYMSYQDAISKENATAVFTEKYNKEKVRVIKIKDISTELCGGTHATNTSEISLFKILQIQNISSGIKRIVAKVSTSAFKLFQDEHKITTTLMNDYKLSYDKLPSILSMHEEKRNSYEKKIKTQHKELTSFIESYLIFNKKSFNQFTYTWFETTLEDFSPIEILQKVQSDVDIAWALIKKTNQISIAIIYKETIGKKIIDAKIQELLKTELSFKGKSTEKTTNGIILKVNNINIENFIIKNILSNL